MKGFQAAAVAAEMRYKGRFDLGLILTPQPAAWAGVFTQNICQAAPVLWSRQKAALGWGRAFLVNAGQANAQTGSQGQENCLISAQLLAQALNCQPDEIMLASTGVIGPQINMDALTSAIPKLVGSLSPDRLPDFAQAIMTTDTFPKIASDSFIYNGQTISIWGCAKGSGMIAPNMATMLSFILTDAQIEPAILHNLLAEGAELSFNRVTVDGDTSTNDSLMIMASGAAMAGPLDQPQALDLFRSCLFKVMQNLARQVAKDGEGATKLVQVRVQGAASPDDARRAARTVAESPLVKTAFCGADANWGRICMALGRSGASFNPYQVNIDLDQVPWIRNGVDNGQEAAASAVMQLPEYRLDIHLASGTHEYEIMTCDFSHDYISINGSYRS